MTAVWIGARVIVVLAILGAVIAVLPPASIYDTGDLTIPDVLWDPFVGVLHLGRLLPLATIFILMGLTLGIQVGLATVWLVSWLLRHLLGSS